MKWQVSFCIALCALLGTEQLDYFLTQSFQQSCKVGTSVLWISGEDRKLSKVSYLLPRVVDVDLD